MFTDLEEALSALGYGGGASRAELASAGLTFKRQRTRDVPTKAQRGSRKAEMAKVKERRREQFPGKLSTRLEKLGVLNTAKMICVNRGLIAPDGNADLMAMIGWPPVAPSRAPEAIQARVDLAFCLYRKNLTLPEIAAVFRWPTLTLTSWLSSRGIAL